MMTVPLRIEKRGVVTFLMLSDGERGNPLGPELIDALDRALTATEADAGCRAVILEAEGVDFCRGMDLDKLEFLQTGEHAGRLFDVLHKLRNGSKPTIAHVRGHALGGGVGLAAACDIVIATPTAAFSLPEVYLGLLPALIMPSLLRRLGEHRSTYLSMSMRQIPATEALSWGLVDEVDSPQGGALERQVKNLLRCSPAALATLKGYVPTLLQATGDAKRTAAVRAFHAQVNEPAAAAAVRAFVTDGQTPPWCERYVRATE